MRLALTPLLQRFAERTPLPVMVRAVLERCLNPEQLDAWFEQVAAHQYTRTLLFSTVFDLLSQVVCRQQPAVKAAYQAALESVGVSLTSLSQQAQRRGAEHLGRAGSAPRRSRRRRWPGRCLRQPVPRGWPATCCGCWMAMRWRHASIASWRPAPARRPRCRGSRWWCLTRRST